MRLNLAFSFSVCFAFIGVSQELVPFLKGEKYGYSDLQGNLKIEALYDYAEFMNKGIGIVKIGENFGAVDKTGKVIADFIYQTISVEQANNKTYLVVRANQYYGMKDEFGTEVIPCEFKDVAFWGDGFVGLNPKSCTVFNSDYKNINTIEGSSIVFNQEQKILYVLDEKEVVFYNNRGNKFLKIKNHTNIEPIGSDFVIVEKGKSSTVVTSLGKVVEKSEKFEDIQSKNEWLLLKYKDKWSLLNKKGDYILKSEYDEIKIVNDQLIGGRVGKNFALFDYSGKQITPFVFRRVDKYSSTDKYIKAFRSSDQDVLFADGRPTGIKSVSAVNEQTLESDQVIFKEFDWGVMNFKGDTIIAPVYDRLNTTVSKKHYLIKTNGKWGLLTLNGDLVLETKFDRLQEKDDYYLGTIGEVNYILSSSGEEMSIVKDEWASIANQLKVPTNLFALTLGEQLGIVNANGEIIVPIEYDEIDSLSGLIIVSKGKDKYAYRLNGEKVFEEPYSSFEKTDLWLKVKKQEGEQEYTGLYNLQANDWFLDPDWKDIKLFNNDKFFTLKSKIDYYGIADTSYKLLVKPSNEELRPYNDDSELYLKVTDKGYYLMRIDETVVYEKPFQEVTIWRGSPLGVFIFKVMRDEKFGLMDFEGHMLFEVEYEEIADAPRQNERYLRIGKKGKWGMIDNRAREIIKPIYSDISQLESGWFWVIEEKGSKPFLIDPNGKAYSDHLLEESN